MKCHLEIQDPNNPPDWIWGGGPYGSKEAGIERAKRLIEVIPLVKVRIIEYREGEVLWSNVV